MAITARDIVKKGLRLITVVGTGSDMSAEDANDGLSSLNAMLASFSVEGDTTYSQVVETFPLTAGVGEYTIGVGGDFDTGIPTRIMAMTYKIGDVEYTITPYSVEQYADISIKSISGIPDTYWFDSGYPLAKIRLSDLPSTDGVLTIYSEKPLTSFATLDTEYTFPAEYQAMLEYNLAVIIAPEYEREAAVSVKQYAKRTFNAIRSANKRNGINISTMDVPTSENSSSSYSIYGSNT